MDARTMAMMAMLVVETMVMALAGCGGASPASFAPEGTQEQHDAGRPRDAGADGDAAPDAGGRECDGDWCPPIDPCPGVPGCPEGDSDPDATPDVVEAGACTWSGPAGATTGCWPIAQAGSAVGYECEPGGSVSFLSDCTDAGSSIGRPCAPDAGPCEQVLCGTNGGACSVMARGVVVCIDGASTAAEQFAAYEATYSLACANGWTPTSISAPNGNSYAAWCCGGCCP